MNKTQLVDALAARIGDRRTAATAVDGLLDTIVETVKGGDSVSITGFGVFEPRARAARTARNPRTGAAVEVAATTVPAFRPGAGFRAAVGGGSAPAPRATPARAVSAPAAEAAPVAEETVPATPAAKAPRKSAKSKSFAAAPAAAEEPKATKGKAAKGKEAKAAKEAPKKNSPKSAKDGGKSKSARSGK